jgi:cytidylate kinase
MAMRGMINEMTRAKLLTIQGSARGGKGTLARALDESLSLHKKVHKIDQGLKFRILAHTALSAGIDIENLDQLAEFIAKPETKKVVIDKLVEAAEWDKQRLEAEYYSFKISNASGMVGKLPVAHDVAVMLLLAEIREVASKFDVIIVDGRALQKYGKQLAEEQIVDYILAIDVHCDAFVSAQRETKVFSPEDEQEAERYSPEQMMGLLIATRDIARRNSSDARRQRDPSLPIRGAFDFDVLHQMADDEKEWTFEAVKQNGAITVDNSNTRSPHQLTEPIVELVNYLLNY